MKMLLSLFLTIITLNAFTQVFTDLYGDYLGQTPPCDTPVVFAPGIVSTKNLEHSAAIFSSDGKETYWVSGENLNSNNYIQRLWYMQRINNRWTKPEKIQLTPDSIGISGIFLSADNNTLYFSAKTNNVGNDGVNPNNWMQYYNYDIWQVNRKEQGWSTPVNISPTINTRYLQSTPSLTNTNTIYFLSYLDGVKSGCGIFKSELKKGAYTKPIALPACINSVEAQDWTPFIAPDDSYIVFSSYREGQTGSGDLYISFHNIENDTWSEAINMGIPINTRRQERFPYVTSDGKYLFFTRSRKGYSQDIWWVKADIIEKLKTNAINCNHE